MKVIMIIVIMTMASARLPAQGCSDAGFCSLGALKEANLHGASKRSLDIGSTIGLGEQSTFTFNPYLQYNQEIGQQFSVQAKITATYASGFLGQVVDAGDFYALVTYSNRKRRLNTWRWLGGIKIPFNAANTKNDEGKPLPLDYQSSIGTWDVIAGINYLVREHLEFSTGVQWPIVQINKNSFFPDEYADARAQQFAPTNQFRRKPDVLLRGGYYVKLSSTVTIKPNLLAIYHLGKDTYRNRVNKETQIDGSAGLTVNAGLIATKRFKNRTRLELIAATPLIARDVRADGLTRKAAFNVQYSILF